MEYKPLTYKFNKLVPYLIFFPLGMMYVKKFSGEYF